MCLFSNFNKLQNRGLNKPFCNQISTQNILSVLKTTLPSYDQFLPEKSVTAEKTANLMTVSSLCTPHNITVFTTLLLRCFTENYFLWGILRYKKVNLQKGP